MNNQFNVSEISVINAFITSSFLYTEVSQSWTSKITRPVRFSYAKPTYHFMYLVCINLYFVSKYVQINWKIIWECETKHDYNLRLDIIVGNCGTDRCK